jgi:hypothetical protein
MGTVAALYTLNKRLSSNDNLFVVKKEEETLLIPTNQKMLRRLQAG